MKKKFFKGIIGFLPTDLACASDVACGAKTRVAVEVIDLTRASI